MAPPTGQRGWRSAAQGSAAVNMTLWSGAPALDRRVITERFAPLNAPGLSSLPGCRSPGVAGSANVPLLPEPTESSLASEPIESSVAPLFAPAERGLSGGDTLPVGVASPPTRRSPDPAPRTTTCPYPEEHVARVCQCSPSPTPPRVGPKPVLQERVQTGVLPRATVKQGKPPARRYVRDQQPKEFKAGRVRPLVQNEPLRVVDQCKVKRPKGAKWLSRRPTVRLRRTDQSGASQPWMRVADVEYAWLQAGQVAQQQCTVALSVVRQLSWDTPEVGSQIPLQVRMGDDVTTLHALVVAESLPSLVLGEEAMRWLLHEGWKPDEAGWLLDAEEPDLWEPEEVEGDMVFWDRGSVGEDCEQSLTDDEDFWAHQARLHQRLAVDGEEPGGLITGEQFAPAKELLRDVWRGLEQPATGLPSGPDYTTAEDNPPEFKARVQEFVPGGIHAKLDAWRSMEPAVDTEVLHWVQHGYRVPHREEGVGLRLRNGRAARDNPDALQRLVMKRLRNQSWECTSTVVNVLPANIAPKAGDADGRLILNGQPLNEFYNTWRVRYEGMQTVPLCVTKGCWMISIDLYSGYDAVHLTKDSRGLFGVEVTFSAENLAALREEGLLEDSAIQRWLPDGSAVVLVQPLTLPQGFTNSCAVFTKLTRQLVRSLRARGVRCVHLLDDFLFAADSPGEAELLRDMVIKECEDLGLFISWKKAVLTPTQRIRFLGFVVDSLAMRFYVPGDKVEALEDLIREYLVEPDQVTYRRLAQMAGKIISMATALPPARLFTREVYQHIRPEGDWDAALPAVTPEMVQELRDVLEWLRVFNVKGAPITKRHRAAGFRIMMDASAGGFGVRLDGTADLAWSQTSWAMAGQWSGAALTEQSHRELQALHEVLSRACQELDSGVQKWGLLRWVQRNRLLLWSDSVAAVAYVNRGCGSSDVMYGIMKEVWAMCLKLECSIFAEHTKGTELVAAGVDAMSRASEFSLNHKCFKVLDGSPRFGKQRGCRGFTIDACASQKTCRKVRYFSRGAVGKGSLGDIRTVELREDENYYVCPPVGLIELVIKRLEEAGACGTLVVPNWTGKAWHVYLRQRAHTVEKLPWSSWAGSTWLDVSEKKAKPHVLANRWEFVAFAVDFRRGAPPSVGLLAVPRWKESQPRPEPSCKLDFGFRGKLKGHKSTLFHAVPTVRVLSLAGGIGSVGWCMERIKGLFGLNVVVEVVEVEIDPVARALAARMGGAVSRQHDQHDVWAWVQDPGRCRAFVRGLGRVDCVVCGFPCQSMSTANKRGQGLRGDKSSAYFAMVQVLRVVREFNAKASFVYECTYFKQRHPRDWAFVCHDLGVQPMVLDAGTISPVWRKRAFWASFETLPLRPREVPVIQVLEEHRRPAWRWRQKLPTIMASGPRSWNQKDCVQTWHAEAAQWRSGSLRIGEVEAAMGYGRDCTLHVMGEDGVQLSETQRWHGMGNAIHAGILSHMLVSMLVAQGVIDRHDQRLESQAWTQLAVPWHQLADLTHQEYAGEHSLEGDGPVDDVWAVLVAAVSAHGTNTQPLKAAGQGRQRAKKPRQQPVQKGKRVAQWRVDLAKAKRVAPPQEQAPSFSSIFNDVDEKGVPRRKHIGRALGAPRPQQASGQLFWDFVDEVARDLMILSRADSTWKTYAAWYEVFVEFCSVMGVDPLGRLEDLHSALLRSATLLWLGAGYAASTIELYVTAVVSTVKDRGQGCLRDHPDLKKLLEGINRNLGNAAKKKLAIEGRHLRALLTRATPPNDAKAWTGEWASLQWFQAVAFMVLGWCAYLRCSEILGLQICDLAWYEDQVQVLVRRTKADQRGVTTTTCVDALVEGGDRGSDICLLSYLRGYVTTVLLPEGVGHRMKGCTRDMPGKRAMDCPVCPWLFPTISVRGVQPAVQTAPETLRRRMKAACRLLEDDGVLPQGATADFSVISLRRGGNSVCAARGVRDKVRTHHGRWGLAAQVARGLTSEGEYNSVLARDDGAVSKALHADVNEEQPARRRC